MSIIELSAIEIREKIKSGELTCVEVVKAFLDRIEETKEYNAILEVFDDAIEQAKLMDEKIKAGFRGRLAGVPIIIKDNIMCKGKIASCASKILEKFVSPYNSTVVERILSEGAIILGRANMDEFAMGSATENSAFGITHNPLAFDRVPGGSSGGSACAVALNMCPVALGTDTGGSVRQPASYCGLYGMKPSYGRISRYGIVAYGSSLDQVGVFSKSIEDNALLLEIMAGEDIHDETSSKTKVDNYTDLTFDISSMKIGVPSEILEMSKDMPSEKNYLEFIEFLKSQGANIVPVTLKNIELCLPTYYILAWAEVTSNLSRFDGVKYTYRDEDAKNLQDIYKKSRSIGFGKEVKRRIMLGNYVLSSGYYEAYYKKAKAIQGLLTKQFESAFNDCDIILMPTTVGVAYKIGSKPNDPIETYKEDIFTVTANTVGVPSLSIPYGKGEDNMPLGIQLMAKKFDESKIYKLAKFIEERK